MLAASPWSLAIPCYDTYHSYIPRRPSPLSPRSANARKHPIFRHHSPLDENASMPPANNDSNDKPGRSPPRPHAHNTRPELPFSARPVKANPLLQRQKAPAAREQRRKMFLQRVARGRDDARFATRGEQLLRLDFQSERRRWADEMARSAPFADAHLDSEEDGLVLSQASAGFPAISQASAMSVDQSSSVSVVDEQSEAELQREREEAEMEELLALMDAAETQRSSQYGSDDEEYEDIFSELARREESERVGLVGQHEQGGFEMAEGEDEMDMSA